MALFVIILSKNVEKSAKEAHYMVVHTGQLLHKILRLLGDCQNQLRLHNQEVFQQFNNKKSHKGERLKWSQQL